MKHIGAVLCFAFLFLFATVACQGEQKHRQKYAAPSPNSSNVEESETTSATLHLRIHPENPELDYSKLTYKLVYQNYEKTGKANFFESEAEVYLENLPKGQKGEIRIELYEAHTLILAAVKDDFTFTGEEVAPIEFILFEIDDSGEPVEPPAENLLPGDPIKDMRLELAADWKIYQRAENGGILLFSFIPDEGEHLFFYVREQLDLDINQIFVNNSEIVGEEREKEFNSHIWRILETKKNENYVAAFLTEFNGNTYYGYSQASSSANALTNIETFLQGLK